MATHGELSAFNPVQEHWTAYIEGAHQFIANDAKKDEKKHAVLFSGCGPETQYTIRSSYSGCRDSTKLTDECIAVFVTSLCKIAEHCKYKDSLKGMLRVSHV